MNVTGWYLYYWDGRVEEYDDEDLTDDEWEETWCEECDNWLCDCTCRKEEE